MVRLSVARERLGDPWRSRSSAHLMLYADPGKPFFCVEPQSNASGAFNREGGFTDPAEGVRVLAPGETLAGTVRFEAGFTVIA